MIIQNYFLLFIEEINNYDNQVLISLKYSSKMVIF